MAWRQIIRVGALAVLTGGSLYEWLGVPALSVAAVVAVSAMGFEYSRVRANARHRGIVEAWPSVIDSLESAAIAGLSIRESLRDISESEQIYVTADFRICCDQLDAGVGIDSALRNLKLRLATAPSDFTIELLRATVALGSAGYIDALRMQAKTLREQMLLLDQVAAKQGWVVGTAKLAVLAPWLIVIVLSIRSDNAASYSTLAGTFLLLLGLLASVVAFRLVYRIAGAASAVRVFA